MKTFVKKIKLLPIVAGILSSSVPMLNVALAVAISLTMAINNTSSTSYTMAPFIKNTNNEILIASGQLLPSGLDSRITDSSGNSLPRMLADNNTLFTANSTAHTQSTYTFTTGNTPTSTMPIITGSSGNFSTADAPDLELDRHFDVSISGYLNTSVNGTSQSVIYKQGAAKINVSAPGTLMFHALNGDDSDNWTMSGAVASGNHTVRIWADGLNAHFTIDGSDVATHSLISATNSTIGNVGQTDFYGANWRILNFHAAGLFWVFYQTTGSNLGYTTSADMITWAATTNLTSDNHTTNRNIAVCYDGTHMFYVRTYAHGPADGAIYFREGTPNGDGSITWLAAEQTVLSGLNTPNCPSIAAWSNHAQITYTDSGPQDFILKNNNTDGTWAMAGGYPLQLSADTTAGLSPAVLSVSGPGITTGYVLYAKYFSYNQILGEYYNGSSWTGVVDSISSIAAGSSYCVPVLDSAGNVYIVYETTVSSSVKMRIRNTSGSLSSPTTLYADAGNNRFPTAVYDPIANQVYVFYSHDGTNLYCVQYNIPSAQVSSEITISTVTLYREIYASAMVQDSEISIVTTNNIGYNNLVHVRVSFPWEWNNTVNNWWWATNNTMSYTDNVSLTVLGVQELFYAPNNMIYGSALPDRSAIGTHTGTIYWGTSTLTVSGAALLTLPATNITTSSAVLNGQLLDMVGMSSFSTYFDFGLTTSYGYTTSIALMSAPGLLSSNVTGLFSGTTYHFRAVAVSSNITLYGGDLTFTTTGQPGGGTFQFGGGNARVFKNYITANDTLITAEIVNTYVPYYPNQSPKEYFTVQLISTDNSTILAATPQQDWGDKPIGIYLNPTQSRTITDGAGYYVRVQANFASNVSVQYQLQNVPWANDWKGSDLTKLDDWAIYVALDMQTFYSGSGYVTVLTDRKLAITDAVGGYFTAGIAGIGQIRPNLFTTSQQSPVFSSGISALPTDNLTAYTAYVGSNIATDAAVIATPFGLTARDVLAGIICLAMLGVIMTGTSMMGGFGALGLFLISIPFLWLGTYFKIIGVQWVMILTIIFGFFAVRQFIIKTT